MKKMLLPGIGLLLGLFGGTAWTVVTFEPPVEMVADSLAADSAQAVADEHHGDEGGASQEAHDAAAAPTRPTAASHDPGAGHSPALQAPAGDAVVDRDPASSAESETSEGAAQLARIFAAMQPADAARVLGHLRDAEIREVLTRMGTRQAAAVLSNMTAERAAVLSRGVLFGEGSR